MVEASCSPLRGRRTSGRLNGTLGDHKVTIGTRTHYPQAPRMPMSTGRSLLQSVFEAAHRLLLSQWQRLGSARGLCFGVFFSLFSYWTVEKNSEKILLVIYILLQVSKI